ncbi:MAG: Nif3-like dinuclear metal center hexameric protein [Planctomycetes bacterium]|nr:Nif3-like dinuclear metal center hexameric protein [Planctomycetota bacterium]
MIGELALAMEAVAPSRLAAEWDKVGLLLGDPARPLRKALLCIDLTEETLAEALRLKCQAVVAYHPPIFEPLTRLTAWDPRGALLLKAAERGVALLSPHTALDAVQGGVTDWLAGLLGRGERRPIEPAEAGRPTERLKLVTFVPAYAVQVVREAMAAAGAGRIGAYTHCSFESPGHGTFHGGAGTNPAVGRRGRLERVEEIRLEMVCGRRERIAAVRAIRSAHPYEEPAIEVHGLDPGMDAAQGHGRIVELERPLTSADALRRLRTGLRLPAGSIHMVEGRRGRKHRRVGVVPGAGFSMLAKAADQGCTLFVTGEARHHDQLAARARGCDLLLAGHTQTERGFLPMLARMLEPHVPGVKLLVSKADAPPARLA